jgi:hypothetical protein
MEEMRNARTISVGKPEGVKRLGRHRLWWEDLRATGWEGMDWIYLAQP